MTQTARFEQDDGLLPAPGVLRLAEIALFADLDGTLARLEATPDAVGPDAARRRLLDNLAAALAGRLAVVSGRSLDDLDRVLEGRVTAIGAVHGLVRRTANGRVLGVGVDPRMGEALAAFKAFAKADPALLVEDKGPAVALHFRQAPETAAACRDLARRLAERLNLAIQEGDMVVELRIPGPGKGAAVTSFMTEAPFRGATPVFIGDDLTDEDGFRAARALGGYGVIVGSRRPTSALCALADVDAARAWLWDAVRTAT